MSACVDCSAPCSSNSLCAYCGRPICHECSVEIHVANDRCEIAKVFVFVNGRWIPEAEWRALVRVERF